MSRYWQVKTMAGWWTLGPLEMRVKMNRPLRWDTDTETYGTAGPVMYQATVKHKHNRHLCNIAGRWEPDRALAVAEGLRMLRQRAAALQAKEKAEKAEIKAFWDAQAERDLNRETTTEIPRGFSKPVVRHE